MADVEVKEISASEMTGVDASFVYIDTIVQIVIALFAVLLFFGGTIAFVTIIQIIRISGDYINSDIAILFIVDAICWGILWYLVSEKKIYKKLDASSDQAFVVGVPYIAGHLVKKVLMNRYQLTFGGLRSVEPVKVERFDSTIDFPRVTGKEGAAYRGRLSWTGSADLENPNTAELASRELSQATIKASIEGMLKGNNADIFKQKKRDEWEMDNFNLSVLTEHVKMLLPGIGNAEGIAKRLSQASVSLAIRDLGFRITSLVAEFYEQDDLAEAAELLAKATSFADAAQALHDKTGKPIDECLDIVLFIAGVAKKESLDIKGAKGNISTAAFSKMVTGQKP